MKERIEIKKIFLLFLLFFGIQSVELNAQNYPEKQERITLSGKVVDLTGEPLPGTTIVLEKSNKTVIADSEGKFTLTDIPKNGSLNLFMLGFINTSIKYSGTKFLIIQMKESVQALDEALVTGYSTQVKANLSGAVEQISGSHFANRPVSNLSRGLQGLIPNLNITMYDGNPSRSPTFNVRGATSIGSGGAALVLIDGVEGDPNMLNPNDVESISVLKDASSAAVYGSRGTFGVILITTKKSAEIGKTLVNYSGNYILNKRVIIPDLVTDGYTWANLFNRSHYAWYNAYPTSINSNFPFSQEYLAELKKRSENQSLSKIEINPANGRYIYYDSHNWLEDLYKESNGATEQNLNISHSSDKGSLFFSGRYYNQDGIYRYNSDNYKTYNFRLKTSVKIRKWLEVTDNLEYSNMEYKEPLYYGGYGFTSEI